MESFHTAVEMRRWSHARQAEGKRIGFVPTMGFLHEGHLSLVDLATEQSDFVVVSIFVNPAQFDRKTDLDSYPRDMERDLKLLESRGVAAVYLPDADSMYPDGYSTWVNVEGLTATMEGAKRPGHFRGVTTIVSKLFNAVRPDVALFGQKDAQQAAVIRRMTIDLDFGIEIVVGPTVREEDGLAMSSRNVNLTPEHRAQASALYKSLNAAEELVGSGEVDGDAVATRVREVILENAPDARIDSIDFADWETLQPAERVEGKTLIALAVYFGDVRLIDNRVLEVKS